MEIVTAGNIYPVMLVLDRACETKDVVCIVTLAQAAPDSRFGFSYASYQSGHSEFCIPFLNFELF